MKRVVRRGCVLGLLGAWMGVGAGCGADPVEPASTEPLGSSAETFEAFMGTVARERETGAYLVEGDVAFASLEEVREY